MEEHNSAEFQHMLDEVKGRSKTPIDVSAVRRALAAHVENNNSTTPATTQRSIWTTKYLAYGAAFTVLLFFGFKGFQYANGKFNQAGTVTRDYVTRRAERMDVTLPDGSRAILAPDTRLHFALTGNGSRTVELQGQAYFNVLRNSTRSFTVHAGNSTTKVLGTSFTVRSYKTDKSIQVVVADGKVAVSSSSKSQVLAAGDISSVTYAGQTKVTHVTNVESLMGWTRGELVFDDTPFQEVVYELERAYDLNIRIANAELSSRPIKIRFTGKSANDMLTAFAIALDARFERHGQNVTFSLRK